MKYLCLVYLEERILNAFPAHERQAISSEAMSYCGRLQKAGQLLAASPLHPVETATTVRVREGKTSTTDGIRIAAQFPAARFGSVEVRPMKELGCAD